MDPDLENIVSQTLAAHAESTAAFNRHAALGSFQWPWDIARAGAQHLGQHSGAIDGLVSGGNKFLTSPEGSAVFARVRSNPTDPANTDVVRDSGLFGPALDSIRADQLLRTVFIGYGGGGQAGLLGGSGARGVAYDIVDPSSRTAVSYSEFELGIGAKASAGLVVGAMSAEPRGLNDSTCLWSFGASVVAVGVFVQVLMRSSDLSLIGIALNLGGGGGLASSTGYGSIAAG